MKKLTTIHALQILCMVFLSACASNGAIQVVQDPFVGEQRGFLLYLDVSGNAVSVKTAKGKYTMELVVAQRGHSYEQGRVEQDKAEFLIGDQILTMKNRIAGLPVTNANQYEVYTQWKLTFFMDRNLAARFAAAPLKAIRATVGSHEFQVPLTSGHGEKFQMNMAELTR